MDYQAQYRTYVDIVEQTIENLLPQTNEDCPATVGEIPQRLCESMRYSLLAGGKRVRAVLLLAACDMLGAKPQQAKVFAAALEMIHAYSLIHDDLPGMDDDDYRRGKPSNHKVYGVGHAILAGDALLNYAYELMLQTALSHPENILGLVRAASAIAGCAGVSGMIAGQSLDLLSEHLAPDKQRLLYIHTHKTAALLTAPMIAAAYIAGADEQTVRMLADFGADVGLAFQIDDDLLDVEGDAALLGKQTGADAQHGKMTWPALEGVPASRARSAQLWSDALKTLEPFGESAAFLREMVSHLRERKS